MITKIIIDNFMAHEHTELELGPGVTILTGSNNTGKSAVVEALRCLATNPARSPNPALYIRHGAKEARVEVEVDDGTRVVWVRTKRWAKYEVWAPDAEEPEEYHKLQGRVPEDVARVLRLDQVELETRKDSVDVHLGNQRDPVFLLNQPDSVMAEFFAASTESAHLLAMQNALKIRVRDAKREERALLDQADRVGSDLDRLAPLPDINRRMEQAEDLEKEATALERAIPALESGLAEHRALVAALDREQALGRVLAGILPPPPVQDVDRLKRHIGSMESVSAQQAQAARSAGALAGLGTPPDTADTAPLRNLLRDLAGTVATLNQTSRQQTALAGLTAPPDREDTTRLSGMVDQLYILRSRQKRLARLETVLGNIAEPPAPSPLDKLGNTVTEIAVLTNKISERQAEMETLETDLQSVVVAMEERIRAIGCCPVCGGDLTTDSFLDHGCRHGA
ncbi:AAA family ATPase [uncultured Pseudodesulfovibrio sp.]|uniref:AAA family ATPase n=1 Tax=uncultured Pseudodesulfovibrio sp. TaxID=2035858 RepID=UPI0029C6B738|nr:AAA family ATPase [uncultured Pseudodesulfovibrio sp.]